MEYYGSPNDFRGYLMHYGVKGMHWGIRRYQNTDGTLTDAGRIKYKVKKRLSFNKDINRDINRDHSDYNLDKWGKSKDTNILWITGLSGSGKSTLAKDISEKNRADLINIDLYTFKTADKYSKYMSKSFNKYLDNHVPNWKTLQKEGYEALTKTDRRARKAAGLWFDTFQEALENYGKEQYGKRKIVAEGVQLLDETLFYNNKNVLKNKPIIVMNTDYIDSLISRMSRDGEELDKLLEPERIKQLQNFQYGREELLRLLKGG